MKNHFFFHVAAAVLFAGICLQGCGTLTTPTATRTPTIAHTETETATITSTFTHRPTNTTVRNPTPTRMPTLMLLPSFTLTLTPTTPDCGAADGWWRSEEVVETNWTTTPFPMVQFHVADCHISEFIIVAYLAKGKLFEEDLFTASGAIRNGSFSESFDNPEGAGAFSIYGKFDSGDSWRGFMMFSKGFLVGDYALPNIVTIPFSASLALRNN